MTLEKLRQWFKSSSLHLKLCMRKYLFFYTETPSGEKYLSISQFDRKGLVSRRVFAVTEELQSTPHVEGSKTVQIFLPRT